MLESTSVQADAAEHADSSREDKPTPMPSASSAKHISKAGRIEFY